MTLSFENYQYIISSFNLSIELEENILRHRVYITFGQEEDVQNISEKMIFFDGNFNINTTNKNYQFEGYVFDSIDMFTDSEDDIHSTISFHKNIQ